ncbi:TlyA family RNA methyltransferase [Tindallia californiensis]|uniref:23S rRNA (Cytidine1920-2'-O)/16S rRNA (Cytidine1409-2'-O)-methyltransferase n=1 Tax=Tindallia californiensis TaxID=159292 RepID=A0A1H3NKM6_9FIRM|nr:TlyA family RNA methyltransferase [Tindallia californiensis]SDY89303.1 23S rRNA (cytidine1920-2'-O)/16S rRNA (cytidine1409-2'-O)-methyltransferase [Tindallia californiensis]
MKKKRIDLLLVEKSFFPSREKAKSALMAGLVKVNGELVEKVGTQVDEESDILVKESSMPYVSRGGLKLEKALEIFSLNLENRVCLDIGASTGGFTDCMLQNKASSVIAIDVGYGQLDWKLRNDDRVTVMERTNIRYVTPKELDELADFASIDVSFISLKLVLPAVFELIKPESYLVALVKPQFEAGRDMVGKNGVVRDPSVHKQVIHRVVNECNHIDLKVLDLSFSPIKGPKGNVEFLLLLQKSTSTTSKIDKEKIDLIVEQAHSDLP